jgi:signal transduction histidine kinase
VADLVPVVSVYTLLAAFSAVVVGLLFVQVYRQYADESGPEAATDRDPDLVVPFLLMLAVFVVSAFGYALVTVDGPSELGFGISTVFLISAPWSVFALRYAGRGYLLTRLRIALLSVTVLFVTAVLSVSVVPGLSTDAVPQALQIAVSFLLLGVLGVVFVVGGLVLLSTYRHGSLTLASGAVVVLPVAELLFAGQVTRPSAPVFSSVVLTVMYVAFAATVVLSVTRYDVLSVRPGTGTLGERLVVEKMDEAVFVVGRQGDVARSNETAERMFGADVEGEQFADVLGCPVAELSGQGTIERWTDRGRARFDPRVSTLTSDGGRTLGHAVTLLEVTDREIRQQRIQVLNRILRHNIRNDLDVIRARAEAAADDGRSVERQVETILDVADGLEGLSADARRIEKLIQRSRGTETTVDLAAVVDGVLDTLQPFPSGASVTVDVDPIQVQLNQGLFRFALRNLVANALEHNDSPDPLVEIRGRVTETGVEVVVADDGPGIPEPELAVLETGSEDPLAHATSLGLWGANWAVQTLGGDLSLGTSDLGGAMARIDLPATRLASDDPSQDGSASTAR